MNLNFVVGNIEKSEVTINRNWFNGSFFYIENGTKKTLKSALSPSTHFSTTLTRLYKFTVGINESHDIEIKKTRPLFLAGFRPHTYEVTVDGVLTHQFKSY